MLLKHGVMTEIFGNADIDSDLIRSQPRGSTGKTTHGATRKKARGGVKVLVKLAVPFVSTNWRSNVQLCKSSERSTRATNPVGPVRLTTQFVPMRRAVVTRAGASTYASTSCKSKLSNG